MKKSARWLFQLTICIAILTNFVFAQEGDSRVLIGYNYVYPVENSLNVYPLDKDYSLYRSYDFQSEFAFYNSWKKDDGIRGNQLMYYRDAAENYFLDTNGEGFLYLNTLYKDPCIEYLHWDTSFSMCYNYTTAECQTRESFWYGYFEARIKLPRFKGAHSAFWLFSGAYGPEKNALEIDIFEASIGSVNNTRRHTFTSNFSEYVHDPGALFQEGFIYDESGANSLSDEFHIYAVEWTPFDLRFYLDNQLIRDTAIPVEYEEFPCYVRLGVEVDHANPPDAFTFDPMIIDYVRVYRKTRGYEESTRPKINYQSTVIEPGVMHTASVLNPEVNTNYIWIPDNNCNYNIDGNNDIHFELKPGYRSTILQLISEKELSGVDYYWADQVVFTNRLPSYFDLLMYKNECDAEKKGKVEFSCSGLSEYGVTSTQFRLYYTNEYGDKVGGPIHVHDVPIEEYGVFWVKPKMQYWIENIVDWPTHPGYQSTSRVIFYPTLDPKFSPKVNNVTISQGIVKRFVEGETVEPYLVNNWKLYSTDNYHNNLVQLDEFYQADYKGFCFDLTPYISTHTQFAIEHILEQTNQVKCFPTENRFMYFTSERINDPPNNQYCIPFD